MTKSEEIDRLLLIRGEKLCLAQEAEVSAMTHTNQAEQDKRWAERYREDAKALWDAAQALKDE